MSDKFKRQNPYFSNNLLSDDSEDDNSDNITRTVVAAAVTAVIVSIVFTISSSKNSGLAVIQKYDQMHTSQAH